MPFIHDFVAFKIEALINPEGGCPALPDLSVIIVVIGRF